MPLTLRLVNETTLPNGGPVSIQLSGQPLSAIRRAIDLSDPPDPAKLFRTSIVRSATKTAVIGCTMFPATAPS